MNELNNNNLINNYLNYNANLNINMNSENKIANEFSKKVTTPTSNSTNDSIELDPNKKNIINKINAHKAFDETYDDMGLSVEELGHLTIEYGIITNEMRQQGYYVPDFNLDNSDPKTSSFLPFISQMKEFAKNYFSTGTHLVTSDIFLNFCDKFEEKLKQYDCF